MRLQKFQFPYFGDKEELQHVAASFEPLVPDEPDIDPQEEERERQIQARLDQARDEAYAKGLADGKAQGEEAMRAELEPKHEAAMQAVISEHEASLKQLISQIEQQLTQAGHAWSEQAALAEHEMHHLAWALAKRIAGEALEHQPEASLLPSLEEMLSSIKQSSTLTLRVHPSMVSDLTDRLTPLSETYQLGLNCIGDDRLAPTDADILWEGGHASHRLEHLCQRVEQALSIQPALYTLPEETSASDSQAAPDAVDTEATEASAPTDEPDAPPLTEPDTSEE